MKMAENSKKGKKTQWEKEKLLVTGNFSFSLSVFKRFVWQTKPGPVWERVLQLLNPFPKRQILDSSKLKEFADDNFKLNENDREF